MSGIQQAQLDSDRVTPERPVDDASSDSGSIDSNVRVAHEVQIKSIFHNIAYCLLISATQMFSNGGIGLAAFTARDVAKGIHASSRDMVWFLAAYSLTSGVFVLIAGSIGDVFGPKYVLCAGWLLSAIFTLISGFSVSPIMFDVMRGLAGAGNSLIIPCAFALLARAYPPGSKWKNFSFALLGFFRSFGLCDWRRSGCRYVSLAYLEMGILAILHFAFNSLHCIIRGHSAPPRMWASSCNDA